MATTPAGSTVPPLPPPTSPKDPLDKEWDEDVAVERWNFWRMIVTIATLFAITILAIAIEILFAFVMGLTNAWWIAVPVSGYALYEFIRRGWAEIEFPTKWMPTILGKPLNVLMSWGVFFFPLKHKRLLYFAPVPGIEEELEFAVPMRIPDNSEIEVPFFLYFVIDERNPKQFFIAGGLDTVKEKLQDLTEEVLREFLASSDRGPKTLADARESTFETFNLVLEVLFARDFHRIDAKVPTEILIRFFANRLTQKEKEDWRDYLDELRRDPARQDELNQQVKDRRQLIEDAKIGKIRDGRLFNFGIIVTRLGLKNIEPTGKTEEGVDEVVRARLNAEAKVILSDSIDTQTKKHVTTLMGDAKEAAKAVRVQYGVATEKIEERQFGSDAATLEGIVKIVREFLSGRK